MINQSNLCGSARSVVIVSVGDWKFLRYKRVKTVSIFPYKCTIYSNWGYYSSILKVSSDIILFTASRTYAVTMSSTRDRKLKSCIQTTVPKEIDANAKTAPNMTETLKT